MFRVLEIFELRLLPRGYYRGYNASVNPTVANAFGAAAFRFGHSLVKNTISRYAWNLGKVKSENIFKKTFFRLFFANNSFDVRILVIYLFTLIY